MGFDITWLDDDKRIVRVELRGSLEPTEISQLRMVLKPIADGPSPVYILMAISELNLADAPMRLLAAFDGISTDSINRHLAESRVAIVGGGYTVASLIQIYSSLMQGNNPTKLFDDEDTALTWLTTTANHETTVSA